MLVSFSDFKAEYENVVKKKTKATRSTLLLSQLGNGCILVLRSDAHDISTKGIKITKYLSVSGLIRIEASIIIPILISKKFSISVLTFLATRKIKITVNMERKEDDGML